MSILVNIHTLFGRLFQPTISFFPSYLCEFDYLSFREMHFSFNGIQLIIQLSLFFMGQRWVLDFMQKFILIPVQIFEKKSSVL
jgi:hypothetical protein